MKELDNIKRVLLFILAITVSSFTTSASDHFEGELRFKTWTKSKLQEKPQTSVAVFYLNKRYVRQEVQLNDVDCRITQLDLVEMTKTTALEGKYVLTKSSFADLERTFEEAFSDSGIEQAVQMVENGFRIRLPVSTSVFEVSFSEYDRDTRILEFFDVFRFFEDDAEAVGSFIPERIVYRIGGIEHIYSLEEVVERPLEDSVFELPPVPEDSDFEDVFRVK